MSVSTHSHMITVPSNLLRYSCRISTMRMKCWTKARNMKDFLPGARLASFFSFFCSHWASNSTFSTFLFATIERKREMSEREWTHMRRTLWHTRQISTSLENIILHNSQYELNEVSLTRVCALASFIFFAFFLPPANSWEFFCDFFLCLFLLLLRRLRMFCFSWEFFFFCAFSFHMFRDSDIVHSRRLFFFFLCEQNAEKDEN